MAKFKVYYTIELNEVATHIFETNDFEVKLCSHNDEETYVKELAEFQPDAIMCRTEPITAKMMDTCTNLKVIGKQGAGLDNIDMDHAHAKDITVVYAPAGNANAVAEHAVMLMLMCAKRFTYVDRQFRGGNFLVRMDMEHTYELGGKTLGMIGCGRISQLAMKKCKYGFGMKVIGYDPYMTQEKIGDLCELKETAKEVWEQADFVSVHLPVVPSTEHSIGREQYRCYRPWRFIVRHFKLTVFVRFAGCGIIVFIINENLQVRFRLLTFGVDCRDYCLILIVKQFAVR